MNYTICAVARETKLCIWHVHCNLNHWKMNRVWISDCSHTCKFQFTICLCPDWILQSMAHIRIEIGEYSGVKKRGSGNSYACRKQNWKTGKPKSSLKTEYWILTLFPIIHTFNSDQILSPSCSWHLQNTFCVTSYYAQRTYVSHTSWWKVQELNGWQKILPPSSGS